VGAKPKKIKKRNKDTSSKMSLEGLVFLESLLREGGLFESSFAAEDEVPGTGKRKTAKDAERKVAQAVQAARTERAAREFLFAKVQFFHFFLFEYE
jgi:hypothetical protein